MICLICRQAEILSEFASVHFARDEMNVTVNHIRANVCPSCGESYLDEDVATSLLRCLEAICLLGIIENDYDYEELIARF